jgi:hypothetical protein
MSNAASFHRGRRVVRELHAPNYFFEWLVWVPSEVSLIPAAVASNFNAWPRTPPPAPSFDLPVDRPPGGA